MNSATKKKTNSLHFSCGVVPLLIARVTKSVCKDENPKVSFERN